MGKIVRSEAEVCNTSQEKFSTSDTVENVLDAFKSLGISEVSCTHKNLL